MIQLTWPAWRFVVPRVFALFLLRFWKGSCFLYQMQASVAYQCLTSLVRGDYPPNILPATPPGYLVARIHQLAGAHECGVQERGNKAVKHAPVDLAASGMQKDTACQLLRGMAAGSGRVDPGAPSCPLILRWSFTCLPPTWQPRSGFFNR